MHSCTRGLGPAVASISSSPQVSQPSGRTLLVVSAKGRPGLPVTLAPFDWPLVRLVGMMQPSRLESHGSAQWVAAMLPWSKTAHSLVRTCVGRKNGAITKSRATLDWYGWGPLEATDHKVPHITKQEKRRRAPKNQPRARRRMQIPGMDPRIYGDASFQS